MTLLVILYITAVNAVLPYWSARFASTFLATFYHGPVEGESFVA